jgi:opacity protein-like surface antigen
MFDPKKITLMALISASLGTASMAFSGTLNLDSLTNTSENGFYVLAGGGLSMQHAQSDSYLTLPQSGAKTDPAKSKKDATHPFARLALGYGRTYHNVYLGAELDAKYNLNSKITSETSANVTNSFAYQLPFDTLIDYQLEAGLRAGYNIQGYLPYLRVAYTYAHAKQNYTFETYFNQQKHQTSYTKKIGLSGITVGLGLDLPVSSSVKLNAEVDYTGLPKTSNTETLTQTGTTYEVHTTDGKRNQVSVMLGLMYGF